MESVEVCIVGAGVAGLSAAWRLALDGREVLVLERFSLGHDRGSSHGATRIFRFAYDDPTYVQLARAALPLWRDLEAACGEEVLRVTGGLDVGSPAMLDGVERALTSCGSVSERLDPKAISKRFPWLHASDASALYSPDTGVLAAARALDAMAVAAQSHGAKIEEGTSVERLEPGDDSVRVVAGDGSVIEARRCVVAAGSWGPDLVRPVGARIPAKVTREQVFYFTGPADVLPFIHYDSPMRYAVPHFAGAAGIKVAEHMTGEETSGSGRSFDMDPEGAARIAAYVSEALPDLDPEPVGFETCLYTTTPDEGFVLDRVGPVILASPCSGHGFKFGPITGEILASLATDREPPVPIDAFSLARFAR